MTPLQMLPARETVSGLIEALNRICPPGLDPTDYWLTNLYNRANPVELTMLADQSLYIVTSHREPDPKMEPDGYRSMARAALEQYHYLATGEIYEASIFEDADILSVYTRAQAIEDGVLIDVSDTAREAGFTYPLALTRALWEDCVAWNEADSRRQTHQDEAGRLWDVLTCARLAIGEARPGQTLVRGQVLRVPRGGRARRPRPAFFKAHCGPGDAGEPVITLMLPDED